MNTEFNLFTQAILFVLLFLESILSLYYTNVHFILQKIGWTSLGSKESDTAEWLNWITNNSLVFRTLKDKIIVPNSIYYVNVLRIDAKKYWIFLLNSVAMWVTLCFPICVTIIYHILISSKLPYMLAKLSRPTWRRPHCK